MVYYKKVGFKDLNSILLFAVCERKQTHEQISVD